MLVVAVFMTSMIAPIMAPVAIVMGCIIMPAQLSVARVRSMDATLAPVLIIMPVKMPVGGDPIAIFSPDAFCRGSSVSNDVCHEPFHKPFHESCAYRHS
jgi:hypothetical protein